jgi:hypothetical protein
VLRVARALVIHQGCYVSTARSARLEQVLDDGYAVCSAPGVVASWYAVYELTPWDVGQHKEVP